MLKVANNNSFHYFKNRAGCPNIALKFFSPYFSKNIAGCPNTPLNLFSPSLPKNIAGFLNIKHSKSDIKITLKRNFENSVLNETHSKDNYYGGVSFTLFSNLGEEENDSVLFLINSMDIMRRCPSIPEIKESAMQAIISDQKYGCYLEAGCGTGEDAEYIAASVSRYHSRVIAVDNSKLMLDKAKARSKEKNVMYKIADVYKLPYDTGYFNGIHADRLLVSSINPQGIINEMVRVLKPGGKIAITDVDAKSIEIKPDNQNTKIFIGQLLSDFRNVTIGSDVPGMFEKSGLSIIRREEKTSTINDLDTFEKIFMVEDVLNKAVNLGNLTKEGAIKWYNSLKELDKSGEFLYTVKFFTTVGCKPKIS